MKSTKYLKILLQNVFERYDMDAELEPIITELKTGLEERDAHLAEFGEFKMDGEGDDFTFSPKNAATPPGVNEWEQKYTELKGRYVNRFMNGDESAFDRNAKTAEQNQAPGPGSLSVEPSVPDVANLLVHE